MRYVLTDFGLTDDKNTKQKCNSIHKNIKEATEMPISLENSV